MMVLQKVLMAKSPFSPASAGDATVHALLFFLLCPQHPNGTVEEVALWFQQEQMDLQTPKEYTSSPKLLRKAAAP